MDNRAEVNDIRVRLQEDIDLLHDINDHIMQITERMEEEQRQGMPELQRQLNQQRRAAAQAEARIAADKTLLGLLSEGTASETRLANNIRFLLSCTVSPLTCTLRNRTVNITRIADIVNLSPREVRRCLSQHRQSGRGDDTEVKNRLAIFAGFPPFLVDTIFIANNAQ